MNRQIADSIFEIEVCMNKLRFILNDIDNATSTAHDNIFMYQKSQEEANIYTTIAIDYAAQISNLLQSITADEDESKGSEGE